MNKKNIRRIYNDTFLDRNNNGSIAKRNYKDTFISKDYTASVAMNYSGIRPLTDKEIERYLDSSGNKTQSTALVEKILKEDWSPTLRFFQPVRTKSTVDSTPTMTQNVELQDMEENTELEGIIRDESEGMTRKRIK